MDEHKYIKERIDDQIEWHNKKAKKYKNFYYTFMIIDVILSSFIPVLTLLLDYYKCISIIIALFGATITILSGLIGLFQFQQHWLDYRLLSERLKYEKYLYVTNTYPYTEDNIDRFNNLVIAVEIIINENNVNWSKCITEAEKQKEEQQNNVGI